jgi:DNA-directed RNA polymerase specialized sigma24 family protein
MQRRYSEAEADDIVQDVFVRLLGSPVLSGADPSKGRFRSLLLAVTRHALADRARKRREPTFETIEVAQRAERDDAFDRAWVLHLSHVAIEKLREEGSPYYEVLAGHIAGLPQERRRLWIARRKLISLIRHEIAMTCASHEEFEQEAAYLSRFLQRNSA